jgi:hypothetical protein
VAVCSSSSGVGAGSRWQQQARLVMPRASLFEPATRPDGSGCRPWLSGTGVVRAEPSAATARPCAEGTSLVTSAEDIFASGRGQIHGARRAGSGGLQAAPAATRTSPDTLGPGPRAGSSGAGHRASRGAVVQRRSEISDELPLDLSSD